MFCACLFYAPSPSKANLEENECKTIAYADSEKGFIAPYMPLMASFYEKAGMCVSFISLPYTRSMMMAQNNQIDAIFARSEPFIKKAPDLPYIPIVLANLKGYIIGPQHILENMDSPEEELGLRIGALQGSDWSEYIKIEASGEIVTVKDVLQLLDMLDKHRIDGFLVHELFLQTIEKDIVERGYSSRHLINVPVYHFLSPKNNHLVPVLTQSIKDILSEDLKK